MTAGWDQQPPAPVYRVMAWSLPLMAFVTVLAVLAAACDGGGAQDRSATPTQTASAAAGDFPRESDWRDCVLPGGGPPPGFSVEGRCASESVAEGDGLRVTEVQEWRCEDFSGIGPGWEPCDGEFGRYAVVSIGWAGDYNVVSVSGQFPPTSAAAGDFPRESDWRDCELHGGGPPPGFSVEGRCASESVAEGGGLRVTEVQEWLCEDFSGIGPGYETCSGEFGRHTVVSIVRGGASEVVSASGQLPPGAVQ